MIHGCGDCNTNCIQIKDQKILQFDLDSGWCIGHVKYDEYVDAENLGWIDVTLVRREPLHKGEKGEWIRLGHLMRTMDHPWSEWFKCPFCGHEQYTVGLDFLPKICYNCQAELEYDRRKKLDLLSEEEGAEP